MKNHFYTTNTRGIAKLIIIMMLLIFIGLFSSVHSIHTRIDATAYPKEPTTLPGRSEEGYAVHFSVPSGMYDTNRLTVVLTAPENYKICYTTDGRIPTMSDCAGEGVVQVVLDNTDPGHLIRYREEMLCPEIKDMTILRNDALPAGRLLWAALADESGNVTDLSANVYFLGNDLYKRYPGALILSVIVNPDDLLNYETGILATGRVYEQWKATPEAAKIIEENRIWEIETNSTQHGKKWERPCTFQIYDGDSHPTICETAGIRITGHLSRRLSQKSFNIYMRSEYGNKKLKYELFKGIDSLKGFRIRAGGNNAEFLKFKDAYLMELVEGREADYSKTNKAVLFLNGEYWGPYILSERITSQMFSSRYAIDDEQVIIFKEGELEEGRSDDIRLYEKLMSFSDRDLTDPVIYSQFTECVNIQSFVDYCAIRIYIGDEDWYPEKNDVLWRTRDKSYDDGKWHFMLYDIENSSGLYGNESTAPETDHFSLAIEQYPLFAACIRNRQFYELFLETIREIGSENYSYAHASNVLDAYIEDWEPFMHDYYLRYGDHQSLWYSSIQQTRDFFEKRYALLIPIIEAYESQGKLP